MARSTRGSTARRAATSGSDARGRARSRGAVPSSISSPSTPARAPRAQRHAVRVGRRDCRRGPAAFARARKGEGARSNRAAPPRRADADNAHVRDYRTSRRNARRCHRDPARALNATSRYRTQPTYVEAQLHEREPAIAELCRLPPESSAHVRRRSPHAPPEDGVDRSVRRPSLPRPALPARRASIVVPAATSAAGASAGPGTTAAPPPRAETPCAAQVPPL